jgi:hypothetical protein
MATTRHIRRWVDRLAAEVAALGSFTAGLPWAAASPAKSISPNPTIEADANGHE